MKTIFSVVLFLLASSAQANISFGIDCMIHDSSGVMLKDLGMVGAMMGGGYQASSDFTYGDLNIEVSLLTNATPEIPKDELSLSILKNGSVTASVTVAATQDLNTVLLEPTENVFLHCTKMEMFR